MERKKALGLYDKLLATNPDVERKGDTMPYTSLNGNMFSLFTKENRLTLRFRRRTRVVSTRYKTTLSEQYGHVQPEYVVVPGLVAGEDERVEALLRHELYICLVVAAEADDEEEDRPAEATTEEVSLHRTNEPYRCPPRSSNTRADRACSAR